MDIGKTHRIDQRAKPSMVDKGVTAKVKATLDFLCAGTHPLRTQWYTVAQVAKLLPGVNEATVRDRLDFLAQTVPGYEAKLPEKRTGFKRVYHSEIAPQPKAEL